MNRKENYWQNKISLFLHDPVHKALKIPGHETRAAEIAELLKVSTPSREAYQAADRIASGLTRAPLPGHSDNESESGSIDFYTNPVLTHPLVKSKPLKAEIPSTATVDSIQKEILKLLDEDLGLTGERDALKEGQLNKKFNNKTEEEWKEALFNYLFFAFRKRLRVKNIGGLGALWDLLPADTRMPDHSIWHHCGLTSAIGSSMKSDPNASVSLVSFAITPVQPFIAKARKLRDSWTASVILSYLSFTGIKTVMKNLGADHVVYPSLHDQSLVEKWLDAEYNMGNFLMEQEEIKALNSGSASIASFPNKFVFVAGTSTVDEIVTEIQKEIQLEWERIAGIVRDYLGKGETYKKLFDYQISDYWTFSYASTKLAGTDDKEAIFNFIPESKIKKELNTITKFASVYSNGDKTAKLYSTTHSLVQSLLAATKSKPVKVRKPQSGKKCPLCGEHEVLHDFSYAGKTAASEYKGKIEGFWKQLRERFNSDGSFAQIGEKEEICAICSIKRFLPVVIKKQGDSELLYKTFHSANNSDFPSTTQLALSRYLYKLTGKVTINSNDHEKLIQYVHNSELEESKDEDSLNIKRIIEEGKSKNITIEEKDKYYAILLMDGDKMGDLINGETLNATWDDVIHPKLSEKFKNPKFAGKSPFKDRLLINDTRIINPALHAAISESLNSFARYAVAPIIEKANGKLIYAGGDDVCAILPLHTALDAADEIRKAYNMSFVKYGKNGTSETDKIDSATIKASLHLGNAEKISISAAVIIAHHKEPLREVIKDAHSVLEGVAKKKIGRNSIAIRLKKRSGGDRDIAFKWNAVNPFLASEKILDSFRNTMKSVSAELTSTGLIYRMKDMEELVKPLISDKQSIEKNKDKIIKLFLYEVEHSRVTSIRTKSEEGKKELKDTAARFAGLCVNPDFSEGVLFNPEGVVIARFLATKKEDE